MTTLSIDLTAKAALAKPRATHRRYNWYSRSFRRKLVDDSVSRKIFFCSVSKTIFNPIKNSIPRFMTVLCKNHFFDRKSLGTGIFSPRKSSFSFPSCHRTEKSLSCKISSPANALTMIKSVSVYNNCDSGPTRNSPGGLGVQVSCHRLIMF